MKITTLCFKSLTLTLIFIHLHTPFAWQLSGIFLQEMEFISPSLHLGWLGDLVSQINVTGWWWASSKLRTQEALHKYAPFSCVPATIYGQVQTNQLADDRPRGTEMTHPIQAILDQPMPGWPNSWLQTAQWTQPKELSPVQVSRSAQLTCRLINNDKKHCLNHSV